MNRQEKGQGFAAWSRKRQSVFSNGQGVYEPFDYRPTLGRVRAVDKDSAFPREMGKYSKKEAGTMQEKSGPM